MEISGQYVSHDLWNKPKGMFKQQFVRPILLVACNEQVWSDFVGSAHHCSRQR